MARPLAVSPHNDSLTLFGQNSRLNSTALHERRIEHAHAKNGDAAIGGARLRRFIHRPSACAALADQPAGPAAADYAPDEIVSNGHKFFGSISRGLAEVVETATNRWGKPNGYILGQEASGAFIGGLRYGEGVMHTRNAGDLRVFWQGPSLGLDAGADGDRTMMLVYNLPATNAIFRRFGGVDGSAYLVGGFGMTALDQRRRLCRPDPLRRRRAPRLQCQLSEIHADIDLEPLLRRRGRSARLSGIRRRDPPPRWARGCGPQTPLRGGVSGAPARAQVAASSLAISSR